MKLNSYLENQKTTKQVNPRAQENEVTNKKWKEKMESMKLKDSLKMINKIGELFSDSLRDMVDVTNIRNERGAVTKDPLNIKIIQKEVTPLVGRPYPHQIYLSAIFLSSLGHIVNSRRTCSTVSYPV